MDFESNYEIARVADFIRSGNFNRVALQFPDELLKDSTRVVGALRDKIRSLVESSDEVEGGANDVKLYVMADTAYGSCCVDEVGALHVNADCVVHYGHTCFSPTSTLPALFVLGKAPVEVSDCVGNLCSCILKGGRPILVLFGLEYAHAIPEIQEALVTELSRINGSTSFLELHYADVKCSLTSPSRTSRSSDGLEVVAEEGLIEGTNKKYSIGGLTWTLPEGQRMEDYLLFYIGSENAAFTNVVLTFNSCEIVRYDVTENCLVTDFSQQKRVLKRRYYLVEKAKDANMIGILVGTLGVAGYLHMIHKMKELITQAGKKAYSFVMGKPNPAKLANFPECDVFIYVSCAQTALLDSKEFLAPIITPFEAMLAFNRGSVWTGDYKMEFRDLISSPFKEAREPAEVARYSFIKGGYVEAFDLQEDGEEEKDGVLALVSATEKALQVRDKAALSTKEAIPRSGAEFFAARSFHGLDISGSGSFPEPFLVGRSGKASGYKDEEDKVRHSNS